MQDSRHVEFDPEFIARYAEQLYGKADSVRIGSAVAGAVVGVLFGAVPLSPVGEFLPVPSTFGLATVLLGALVGGFVGYVIGEGRAFRIRLQAQMVLFQLKLERNTAHEEAARAAAPVAPAPASAPASSPPAPVQSAPPPAPAPVAPTPAPVLDPAPLVPVLPAQHRVVAAVPRPAPQAAPRVPVAPAGAQAALAMPPQMPAPRPTLEAVAPLPAPPAPVTSQRPLEAVPGHEPARLPDDFAPPPLSP